jgi:perosamine synthetase
MRIPMSAPDLTEAETNAVIQVLESNHLSLGPRVREFEERFAEYVGTRHAVAVSSGTAALHLSLIASGIGAGDLVITSPFSFVASANCMLYERAVPIFVDVDPTTGNIDAALVRAAADDLMAGGDRRRRWLPPLMRDAPLPDGSLKAILPVHAFGQPAEMQPISAIARDHGLRVIEDACESVGAEYNTRRAGTLGDAACFAFYPNKQMTTAEGGMIVTNEARVAAICSSLRNQGRDVFDAWLSHTRLGYNYRLNDLACALGIVQLSRLDEMLAKRARVAGWYHERLETSGIQLPSIVATTSRMSWFVYVVRFDSAQDRAIAIEKLASRGIPSRPYFTPIHLQPFYVDTYGYGRGDFPVTEALGDTSLALPFSSVMTEDQVDHVCGELVTVLRRELPRRSEPPARQTQS